MTSNNRNEEIKNRFHACATCRHFHPVKQEKGMRYFCSRLQYETKPNYKFNCWDPKDEVIKLMKKRIEKANEFDHD